LNETLKEMVFGKNAKRCNQLYFQLIHDDALLPTKRDEDAGYDVYPAFDEDYIKIRQGEVKMIPTGIKSAFPSQYVMLLRERGSTGSKGWSLRAGVIDSGYRGEWFIAINNTTNKPMVIAKEPEKFDDERLIVRGYDKAIAQAVMTHAIDLPTKLVNDIDNFKSDRGDRKLGSTD